MTAQRSATVNVIVAIAQTVALASAAALTGSAGLRTQTVTSVADISGGIFLMIGVISSRRLADARHPLGYGRERFFWSFVAAISVFVGGFGVAVAETVQAFVNPRPPGAYAVGYGVLIVVIALDAVSLTVSLRPLVRRAKKRGMARATLLWRGTDPAVTTVVLTSAAGVCAGLIAGAGLAARELTGNPDLDAAASGAISLVLLAISVVLLHTNRELLTGRGLPPEQITLLRAIVGDQKGVVAVPDIFAIVVGPATLIVDGDVVFDDELDVTELESVIVVAATELRRRLPSIAYVYLNPVAAHRTRRRGPVAGAVGGLPEIAEQVSSFATSADGQSARPVATDDTRH